MAVNVYNWSSNFNTRCEGCKVCNAAAIAIVYYTVLGLVKDKETVVWWVHGVGGGGKV